MSDKKVEPPYLSLGTHLRTMRQKLRESVAEVSGAVEIDTDELERFEQGVKLPSEDVLLLLISHFDIRDDEAVQLWELAGYDQHDMFCDHDHQQNVPPHMSKQPVLMVLGLDARVVYTNGISVSADPSGVVMNFTQYVEPTQAAVPVARLGMNHEQAEKVLEALQQALLRDKYTRGPKSLPAPNQSKANRSRKKPERE
ncbi:MAG TPA: helix-turn-helix transcriptional regulator [Candidatus Saccharimonadales bacterium]